MKVNIANNSTLQSLQIKDGFEKWPKPMNCVCHSFWMIYMSNILLPQSGDHNYLTEDNVKQIKEPVYLKIFASRSICTVSSRAVFCPNTKGP